MALCVFAVAACGSVATPGGPGSSTEAAAPSAAAAKVSLTIEVTPRPGAKTKRWTLQCEPTGGTHPDATAACRQLLTAKRPFAPIPHNIMCPMAVAGEQAGTRQATATIKGTWFGAPVEATFSQASGCAAVRWSELGQVFTPIR